MRSRPAPACAPGAAAAGVLTPSADTDAADWARFSRHVARRLRLHTVGGRVGVLLLAHAAHVYMCMPMLHVTKILYGYWLGLLPGWLLCCGWELAMFAAYLRALRRTPDARVVAYTRNERAAGRLFRVVGLMHVSSLPLQASAVLVQLGDVSAAEFMGPGALVTVVFSLKNVACGAVLAAGSAPATVAALSVLVLVSTLLPTVATVFVSAGTLHALATTRPGADEAADAEPAAPLLADTQPAAADAVARLV